MYMTDIQSFLTSTEVVVIILAVIAAVELTKRTTYIFFPNLKKVKVRSAGTEVVVYPNRASKLWALALNFMPVVYGILFSILSASFKVKGNFFDEMLIGGVLGAFSTMAAKIFLRFIPKQYGVDVDLEKYLEPENKKGTKDVVAIKEDQ